MPKTTKQIQIWKQKYETYTLQEFINQTECSLLHGLPNCESWLPGATTDSKVFPELSRII
jgi:hypothetical protein